jgi:dihydroneopterin aldolase
MAAPHPDNNPGMPPSERPNGTPTSASDTSGRVRLVNAVFYGHHGVMQEEHQIGGRFEVDVGVDLDFEEAARHDDLTCTVNYEKVYDFVRTLVTENNFYLIEKLAYRIAHKVQDTYPHVEAIEVTVRKPNPPVGGPCDRAEATYRIDDPGPEA